ncbi:tetratricopeptide repeat protein [Thermogemmatispora tikiterensis]|uniref:Uncharacterized protein n=1 Tax=Thermogemmatispora tikiterensis TaxID=1825093 RepID=A0A328VMT8_9CHLR|nr:tetratricopeptide repeat protein [Thermogemmatispora tikiterensis]RAQ98121.1 hypothetical protein A4R35_21450 [Thermogemmatispora tikiterensis]
MLIANPCQPPDHQPPHLVGLRDQTHMSNTSPQFRAASLAEESDYASQSRRIDSLTKLGRQAFQQGQLAEALRIFEEAWKLAVSAQLPAEAARLQGWCGLIYRRFGRSQLALKAYQSALSFYRRDPDSSWSAFLTSEIGQALRLQGRLSEAFLYCLAGLRLHLQLAEQGRGNTLAIGMSHAALGLVWLSFRELAHAEKHFQAALTYYQQAAYQPGIATLFYYQGLIALAKTQLKRAAELFQQVNMLARDCKGDEEIALLSEYGLGRLAACKKSWPEAISRLRNVCEGAQRLQNRYLQGNSFLEMARVLQHSGQYAAANHCCLQAQALARQEDYRLLLAHSEILLGDLFITQGQVAQAFAHYREGCSLSALTEAQTHLQAKQRLIEGLSSVLQGFGKGSEKFCQRQITGSSLLEGQADEGL